MNSNLRRFIGYNRLNILMAFHLVAIAVQMYLAVTVTSKFWAVNFLLGALYNVWAAYQLTKRIKALNLLRAEMDEELPEGAIVFEN